MSQENVERVRRAYEHFTRGGEFDYEFVDPEIEWRGPKEFPDLAEAHYGHDGIRSYLAKINEALEDYRMSPEEFIDVDDERVLVFSREGGRGRGSQAEVETHPTAHVWTIRDGKAVHMQSYWERDEALAAVGLSR